LFETDRPRYDRLARDWTKLYTLSLLMQKALLSIMAKMYYKKARLPRVSATNIPSLPSEPISDRIAEMLRSSASHA
jgi:hypothetical protein